MIGVNLDAIDDLIKKNSLYLDSLNSSVDRLVKTINEFNNCYSGNSIEYLFSTPINEIRNIQKISGIMENYSNVLMEVKKSYQNQVSNIRSQINHINPD